MFFESWARAAYGISFLEMNNLAKMIPDRPGTKLKEALETTELKAAYQENELYRRVIDAGEPRYAQESCESIGIYTPRSYEIECGGMR